MDTDNGNTKDAARFPGAYERMQQRRREFIESKGGSFTGREFDAETVDEALKILESWRDDTEKGSMERTNRFGDDYVVDEVMAPLMKALLEDKSLVTPGVWDRLKRLTLHKEGAVRRINIHLPDIAVRNPQYMNDARKVLTNSAKHDPLYYRRQHALHGLRYMLRLSRDADAVEEIENTLIGIARDDENENVSSEALNQIGSWARYGYENNVLADPARVMTKLAPLLGQKKIAWSTAHTIRRILWDNIKEIEPAKTGDLRRLFQAQADNAGWLGGGKVRKAVKHVTDTIDMYNDFARAAQDTANAQAQTHFRLYGELSLPRDRQADAQENAKILEHMAPLIGDGRPQVSEWAKFFCRSSIYDSIGLKHIADDDIPCLRAVFQSHADSLRWWNADAKCRYGQVLEALDFRAKYTRG